MVLRVTAADPRYTFTSVTTETLAQQVTRRLTASIIQGDYEPGSLLPAEEELCRQFGVSRSVVRETAKALSMLGLIRIRQGRGTEVLPAESWNVFAPEVLEARAEAGLVDDFLADLLVLRRIVETEAAGLAAERASGEQLERMAEALRQGKEAGDDTQAFASADIAFHDAIFAASGNSALQSLLRMIQPALLAARMASLAASRDGFRRSHREHRAILRAIEGRSPVEASEAMATHLSWTANLPSDRIARRIG
jgi:GntR family transcriptional regulator, galactonate operon transcriptional repressor